MQRRNNMELWIRSQDKIALSQIKQIAIENDKKIIGYNGYCVKLGEYNTKERALEVLDEIQEFLIELDKAVIYSKTSIEDYTNVYEMPKE
jgi:hypothetical protein